MGQKERDGGWALVRGQLKFYSKRSTWRGDYPQAGGVLEKTHLCKGGMKKKWNPK